MKRIFAIFGLSMLHYAAMLMAFSFSFTHSMRHFDDGGANTPFETGMDILTNILFFPGMYIYGLLPLPFHYVAVDWTFSILNSVLWGCLLYLLVSFLLRKRAIQKLSKAEQGAAANP